MYKYDKMFPDFQILQIKMFNYQIFKITQGAGTLNTSG